MNNKTTNLSWPTEEQIAEAKNILVQAEKHKAEQRKEAENSRRNEINRMVQKLTEHGVKWTETHIMDDHPYNPSGLYWEIKATEPVAMTIREGYLWTARQELYEKFFGLLDKASLV